MKKYKSQGTADHVCLTITYKLQAYLKKKAAKEVARTGKLMSWQTYARLVLAGKIKK